MTCHSFFRVLLSLLLLMSQQMAMSAVAAAPVRVANAPSASNAFNPDILLVLGGTYAKLSQDPT